MAIGVGGCCLDCIVVERWDSRIKTRPIRSFVSCKRRCCIRAPLCNCDRTDPITGGRVWVGRACQKISKSRFRRGCCQSVEVVARAYRDNSGAANSGARFWEDGDVSLVRSSPSRSGNTRAIHDIHVRVGIPRFFVKLGILGGAAVIIFSLGACPFTPRGSTYARPSRPLAPRGDKPCSRICLSINHSFFYPYLVHPLGIGIVLCLIAFSNLIEKDTR